MGWFSRKDAGISNLGHHDGPADDGLYRGDAPVLMPGVDGGAPTAYVSGSRPSSSPAPDVSWTQQPPPPPSNGWAPPTGQPGPGPDPTFFGGPPTGAFGGYAPAAPHAAPGSTERVVRRVGLGCFAAVAIITLSSVAAIGLVIFSTVRSSSPDVVDPPATVVGAVDVPVVVRYNDADLRITIGGAQGQPGAGWGSSSTTPNLVIAATLQPTGAPTDRVTIPFVYWRFAPDDGSPEVTLNIISGFEPSIVTSSLTPEQVEAGYLAFETAATSGTLTLQSGYIDPPLVSWQLTANPAVPITSSPGVPVRGQIGLPPFTVTLAGINWVDGANELIRQPPGSGSYLVADLTIASTGEDSSGIIDQGLFVFIPGSGQPVAPVSSGAVQDTTSIASVSGGSTTGFRVAFDIPAEPGTLEMTDDAGRTMIQWPVG